MCVSASSLCQTENHWAEWIKASWSKQVRLSLSVPSCNFSSVVALKDFVGICLTQVSFQWINDRSVLQHAPLSHVNELWAATTLSSTRKTRKPCWKCFKSSTKIRPRSCGIELLCAICGLVQHVCTESDWAQLNVNSFFQICCKSCD